VKVGNRERPEKVKKGYTPSNYLQYQTFRVLIHSGGWRKEEKSSGAGRGTRKKNLFTKKGKKNDVSYNTNLSS
jgi:hypothetical protein